MLNGGDFFWICQFLPTMAWTVSSHTEAQSSGGYMEAPNSRAALTSDLAGEIMHVM